MTALQAAEGARQGYLMTVGITPNGTVGTCEFFHSAFTAGTTTVNIIAVIN